MSISDHFLCHKKHNISLTDTSLFREVIAVSSEKHVKSTDAPCEQNAEFVMMK